MVAYEYTVGNDMMDDGIARIYGSSDDVLKMNAGLLSFRTF